MLSFLLYVQQCNEQAADEEERVHREGGIPNDLVPERTLSDDALELDEGRMNQTMKIFYVKVFLYSTLFSPMANICRYVCTIMVHSTEKTRRPCKQEVCDCKRMGRVLT